MNIDGSILLFRRFGMLGRQRVVKSWRFPRLRFAWDGSADRRQCSGAIPAAYQTNSRSNRI